MDIVKAYKSLTSFVEVVETAANSGESVSEDTLELVKDLKVALSFIYDALELMYTEMKKNK